MQQELQNSPTCPQPSAMPWSLQPSSRVRPKGRIKPTGSESNWGNEATAVTFVLRTQGIYIHFSSQCDYFWSGSAFSWSPCCVGTWIAGSLLTSPFCFHHLPYLDLQAINISEDMNTLGGGSYLSSPFCASACCWGMNTGKGCWDDFVGEPGGNGCCWPQHPSLCLCPRWIPKHTLHLKATSATITENW